MSLVGTESFDALGDSGALMTKGWELVFFGSPQTTTGRTGLATASSAFYGPGLRRKLSAAEEHATLILGWAQQGGLSVDGNPWTGLGSEWVFKSDSGGTVHVTVVLTSTGQFRVTRGTSAGTLLGTSAVGAFPSGGSWKYVEIKVVLSDSVGAVEIRVDEATVLSLTGVDTKNAGTKTVFDTLELGWSKATLLDDVYLCNGAGSTNNDFLGSVHVVALAPGGNGNSSQWVGSDGDSTNNYALVDEMTGIPGAADYVETSTVGEKDTYAFANIPGGYPGDSTIRGVVAYAYADKEDTGDRTLELVARSGGTETATLSVKPNDYAGPTGLLNGTYQWMGAVWETKPGGGAWSPSDVDAAEFGIQSAS